MSARTRTDPGPRARITVDGTEHEVEVGISVAAALRLAGTPAVGSHPVTGRTRGPWCGMGTCFECLAEVDGRPGVRTCITGVHDGLDVRTGR